MSSGVLAADLGLFLRGFAVGFAIAAPVGPVGMLCVQRTLHHGVLTGLLSGLGAATADTLYGVVAAFGLTSVSGALMAHQALLRLSGGVFLCVLGVRTWLRRVETPAESPPASGLLGLYVSTLLLTVANPTTIVAFVAVFAGLGLADGLADYSAATMLVAGVFAGSAFWWLTLAAIAGLFHGRLAPVEMRWINRVSGAILLAFGAVVLLTPWA